MSTPLTLPCELASLGWNAFFDSQRDRLRSHHVLARVASEQREAWLLASEQGELFARISGRLRREVATRLDLPAVGDWVAVRRSADGESVIDVVLSRASCLVRQASGRSSEPQVLAANVDTVVVVTDCGLDLNPRRLERWLEVVEASGALPVVLLNKADLFAGDREEIAATIERLRSGLRVLVGSAVTGSGLEAVRALAGPGQTLALVGSSGVGKSTTLNALLGRGEQATGAVRASDGRGRHVTTHREIFALPDGGLVVDTPGLREIAAWLEGADAGLTGFDDVEALALDCRFRNCGHHEERGCAVVAALESGGLDDGRLGSFRKLQRENAFLVRRQDAALMIAEKKKWRAITKSYRARVPKERR